MAAGVWQIYNEAKLALGQKKIHLGTDTIKVALFLSTSNCGDVALQNAQYATLTNQVGEAYGYLTGGQAVTPTWSGDYSVATKTFTHTSPSWVASGGSIVARFAVIYSDTATNKDLIAYCLLDDTPADVTAPSSYTLLISISGVFTLT